MKKIATYLIITFLNLSIYAQKQIDCDGLNSFNNGYALIRTNNLMHFIDTSGTIMDTLRLDSWTYSESEGSLGNGIFITNGWADGLRKINGETIIPQDYNIKFTNDFFVVKRSVKKIGSEICIFNKDGHKMVSFIDKLMINDIVPLSDNLFAIKQMSNDYYNLYDYKINKISDDKYYNFGKYSEGLIKAQKYIVNINAIKWGFIDSNGNTKIEFVFSNSPSDFSDSLAVIKTTNNKYGYIDNKGNINIEPIYKLAYPFINGFAVINDGSYKGYKIINPKNKIIFDLGRDDIANRYTEQCIEEGNLVRISRNSKKGILNLNTGKVILTEFSTIGKFSSGLSLVRFFENHESKSAYINKNGEIMIIMRKGNNL